MAEEGGTLPNEDEHTFGRPEDDSSHIDVGDDSTSCVVDEDAEIVDVEDECADDEAPSAEDLHHTVYIRTSDGVFNNIDSEHFCNSQSSTAEIVIQEESILNATLHSPSTPPDPPTPSTPISRDKGFKYQWDESVLASVLPVRCRSTNGRLYKSRFGSGGRGRCIKMQDNWYTPSEFEAVCGRACSKDWKRSIRYGGRPLQCLIEDGILRPHAISCTCSSCCDDESMTGPVRLFTPYKRRKRDSSGVDRLIPAKKMGLQKSDSPETIVSITNNDTSIMPSTIRLANAAEIGEAIQILTTDALGNFTVEPLQVVTNVTSLQNSLVGPSNASPCSMGIEISEQKAWWQLEEMVNSLLNQAQLLKQLIESVKQQNAASHQLALQKLRQQLEKEKNEAINTMRIQGEMNLSHAILEERAQRDIAVQQALAQMRAETHQEQVVTGEDKITYAVSWNTSGHSVQLVDASVDLDK